MAAGILIGLLLGLPLGALGAWLALRPRLTKPEDLKQQFLTVALQAMSEGRESMVQLAQEKLAQQQQASAQELAAKQGLIEKSLTTLQKDMAEKLTKVSTLMTDMDKARHATHTTLEQQLKTLNATTGGLSAALANSRTRGQWGERMAEDVLRLAGLQPNIQYRKQVVLSDGVGGRPRPDFTFFLPENRVIHMDVKFPMENYTLYLNAENDISKAGALKSFLSDVRQRIKETGARDYAQAATNSGETPLDYILIFIPNEQIYAFLLENDPAVLDFAMGHKVVPCSPTTLLAVLAMVHQAAHTFALEQKSTEIFTILKALKDQWGKYTGEMTKLGNRLDDAQRSFAELMGTRTRGLDRQFNKLDDIALPAQAETPSLLADLNKSA
jgi:DNA recombination protein RmuC